MIKDRLSELRGVRSAGEHIEADVSAADDEPDDFKELDLDVGHGASFVGPLIKKYSDLLNDFKEIQSNLETLKFMLEAKNAHTFEESEFTKIRQKNVQICNRIINKFKKLESKLAQKHDFRTKARMKRSLYYGFFQRYIQLCAQNEAVLQKYEKQLKKNLQLQSRILNYDLTEDEIDTLIANKQTNLLMDNILTDTENARQQLQELKCRFTELMQLEKSISEVHGLFLRLQTLVVEQGDIVQRIEHHFDEARNYISQGLDDIIEARQVQRTRFGLQEKVLLVGLIILVLLIIVSVNSFRCFMFCKER